MPESELHSGWHYRITNVKSGTILDLSGADYKSIIGYRNKNSNNQHWRIDKVDNGLWTIRNKEKNAKYLGYGYAEPNNYVALQGQEHECKWDIVDRGENKWEIRVPGPPRYTTDLSDHGNATDGTVIHLWEIGHTDNQRWYFDAVPG